MKSNAPIQFDGFTWTVNFKPVANPETLVFLWKKYSMPGDLPRPGITAYICPLQWVNDGDYVWVYGDNQRTHIPNDSFCSCGVPFDVHGTCCEWRNARMVIDPRSLRIVDDRHPGYNTTINEWINRTEKTL